MVFASIIESGFITKSPHAIKDRLDKISASLRAPPPRVGPTKKGNKQNINNKSRTSQNGKKGSKVAPNHFNAGAV